MWPSTSTCRDEQQSANTILYYSNDHDPVSHLGILSIRDRPARCDLYQLVDIVMYHHRTPCFILPVLPASPEYLLLDVLDTFPFTTKILLPERHLVVAPADG